MPGVRPAHTLNSDAPRVRVPAMDADHLGPERVELVVLHAEALHEQVSPTRHGGAFPHDVPTQRRWWFGKHLTHVGRVQNV